VNAGSPWQTSPARNDERCGSRRIDFLGEGNLRQEVAREKGLVTQMGSQIHSAAE
jgi:hypothetical protein